MLRDGSLSPGVTDHAAHEQEGSPTMGVLTRLFRRTQSQTSVQTRQPYDGVSIEPKPTPAPEPDQAQRLRQAVLEAEHRAEAELDDLLPEGDSVDDDSPEEIGDLDLSSTSDLPTGQPLSRKAKAPRSKQELIEELQRNYQEVLGLIRKLDAHLDHASTRSDRLAEVAEQYDELAPVLRKFPEHVAQSLQSVGSELQQTVRNEAIASRELLERIESAILHVGVDIERSTNQQGQLVQTMAEFREGLSDLSRSSIAACDSVQRFQHAAAARDDAMISQIQRARRWLIGLTVGVGIIATAAIILAIIALRG